MSPLLAVPLFVGSLLVTLAAARLFAQRLDRLGARFGFADVLVGLLTALAADGPELSSALVALAKGARSTSVGVLVGSNVFNLAAMIGLSALVVGSVRLPRETLLLEGVVGALATLIVAGVLLGWVSPVVAVGLLLSAGVPYLLLLIYGAPSSPRMPFAGGLARVVAHRQPVKHSPRGQSDPLRHLLALVVLDVTLIVAGSAAMVQAALVLGARWDVSGALLGVLILAPLTSLPNALTALRLAAARRGSALVSETLNSNTINLAAGVAVPALFIGVSAITAVGRLDIAWLIAMTAVCLVLLARPGEMRRVGATVVIGLYVGFVVVQLAA